MLALVARAPILPLGRDVEEFVGSPATTTGIRACCTMDPRDEREDDIRERAVSNAELSDLDRRS
jgi:hypothetical protein